MHSTPAARKPSKTKNCGFHFSLEKLVHSSIELCCTTLLILKKRNINKLLKRPCLAQRINVSDYQQTV